MSFRTRRCDNPRPAYGGRACTGKGEEFRLCNIYRCIRAADFRAEQCGTIFPMALGTQNSEEDKVLGTALWMPYEPSDRQHKCKLACYKQKTREHFITGDNVIDGTPCSYDHPSNICVQGACIEVGCDKILGSPVQEDRCGICAGDGSKCAEQEQSLRKRIRSDGGFTKVFLLPKGARRIELVATSATVNNKSSSSKIHLVINDKKTQMTVLDGSMVPGGSTAAVAEGTRLDFRCSTLQHI